MAHLLMIESWVNPSGMIFPRAVKDLGHRLTLVTRNPDFYKKYAPAGEEHLIFQLADDVIHLDTNQPQALLRKLMQDHDISRFDGVVTAIDYYLETVAEIAQALGLPGTSPQSIRTCRNKRLTRAALNNAGIPDVQSFAATGLDEALQFAEQLGYPHVVKPVDLGGSVLVKLIHSETELREAVGEILNLTHNTREQPRDCSILLEEYLAGEEVSVESFTCRGETVVLGVTDKSVSCSPCFVETGHMFPAALDQRRVEECAVFVQNLLSAVGYRHGFAHTEVKLTPQGPRLIEVNPRWGGNYIADLIQRVTGFNVLQAAVHLATGERPEYTNNHDSAIKSAAVSFLLPPREGTIQAVHGLDQLESSPGVERFEFKPLVGHKVKPLQDNEGYLGYVIAADEEGLNARNLAEMALSKVELVF